ncbi:MAG: PAS domain-containing protein, partial [Alphaproteobacteria bacterium]|nr:PAS domain-containing protein [Alphaproteobacteria bacterium]
MSEEASDIIRRRGVDAPQIAFWSAVAVGVLAAGMAIAGGPEVGRAGGVLLILMVAAGMVLFWFMSRGVGSRVGAFPERGAIETAIVQSSRFDLMMLDALEEAALVTDGELSPIAANAGYITVAETAGVLGDSDRPPAMSRLFGADPALSAPMFRLARAAGARQRRREILPPTTLARGAQSAAFEAHVGPMPGGRVLWRLRELNASQPVQGEAQAELFLDDSPIGFFAARPDGGVVYMNRALRAVLGVGDDPARLRLRDFIKDDVQRLLRRDRRGFRPTQAPIVLRARDGVETPATALTFWTADEDADAQARTLIFFTEAEAPGAIAAPARTPPRAVGAADLAFEYAPFGAALLDGPDPAAAAILDANPALMDMTAGRAAPGANFAELFDASEGPAALAERLRGDESPLHLEIAGNPPLAVHVQLARGADGSSLAYVINVSEQRVLEQRLAQAEKMKEIGMLAGGVAHDF